MREVRDDGGMWVHPEWGTRFPWLAHGITAGADMSLFGGSTTGDVTPRWAALRDRLGFRTIVHARQVHAADVHVHGAMPDGIVISPDADGHATSGVGLLLAVTIADCVPISIVAPEQRAIALLHGGWRGVAAGILERGVDLLATRFGAAAGSLFVHCGPAICGACYEVGPEVPRGLGIEGVPPTHVDVRGVIAARATALGVPSVNVSISGFCTRHGDSPFYSHRAGCAERQLTVMGIRSA